MKLTLPIPSTVNTYWRNTSRGVLISASGRSFRSNVYATVMERLIRAPQPITMYLQVHLILYPPTRQRRDMDNYQKRHSTVSPMPK
ncbi:RusA family crossover junction endodeoxyribonuclease [Pantoea agglomerans]|uniref:RusA family crossover junction endodeoxyribonuclease n=1 Tax=Enterobacter agglomerans TaxID=549 RepID=UPI00201BB27A|nr:RusA family crossover junction endodeoxyribonuclease [Pantoea agglomerans]